MQYIYGILNNNEVVIKGEGYVPEKDTKRSL